MDTPGARGSRDGRHEPPDAGPLRPDALRLDSGRRQFASHSALARHGYEVVAARHGAEALSLVARLRDTGLPAAIVQDGWRVEFLDYDSSHEPPLPRRVFASSGERKVRLAIREWSDE